MTGTIPARLLLEPGRALLENGAPGAAPLTFPEVRELIARSASGPRMTADGVPLGSPLGQLRPEDWIENGWGPSLYYFVQARHALMSRLHEAPVYAAPLTEVRLAQLLKRRTHRTYARLPASAIGQDTVEEICDILRRWESAEDLSAAVLTYAGEAGLATVRMIAGGREQVRPLATTADVRQLIQRAMAGMRAPLTATATVIFVLDLALFAKAQRDDFSLIERLTEMGELAQVIVTLGESLGFGALVTPGFSDSEISDVLKLQPSQTPLYSVTLGPKHTSTPTASIG